MTSPGERNWSREVVEIASLEQRRIGQDLHDSVSQELTALNMLAGNLAETLRSDPSKAPRLVERLILGLKASQQELRAVMRGLLPVSVDSEGLMAALSDLAHRTTQNDKVTCVFDCPKPVLVDDNLVATQLYLIAQEAVHNAVKHSRCRNIRISVESAGAWSCAWKTTASASRPNRTKTTAGSVSASCITAPQSSVGI